MNFYVDFLITVLSLSPCYKKQGDFSLSPKPSWLSFLLEFTDKAFCFYFFSHSFPMLFFPRTANNYFIFCLLLIQCLLHACSTAWRVAGRGELPTTITKFPVIPTSLFSTQFAHVVHMKFPSFFVYWLLCKLAASPSFGADPFLILLSDMTDFNLRVINWGPENLKLS